MSKVSITHRKERTRVVLRVLSDLFPEPKIALKYSNHWELLVAVALSAQCTDKKVNEVTDHLFKKYKRLDDYVHADPAEFEQDIRSTGFYRNKTKNILAAAKKVAKEFAGRVPNTMDELLSIPSVGRKTANVILTEAFHAPVGIAVDTHVTRLVNKYGLLSKKTKNPDIIERELMDLLEKKYWQTFTLQMIEYGREYSPAHKQESQDDPISLALLDAGLL